MNPEIQAYNNLLSPEEKIITDTLAKALTEGLPSATSKIWHAHPVWFMDGNPIAGYSKQKPGIRLMFWSGADFEEEKLKIRGEKFKDASIFFNHISEIDLDSLQKWIQKSIDIQWDYKNIVKRKGQLVRLA